MSDYRPEVDGLRAIAVFAVLIFHLDKLWLSGGFIGVDVFFVISGYVIGRILWRDMEDGTFSWFKFYQRRISRIIPVSFFVGVVTLASSWLIYSPQGAAVTGSNLVAAVLFLPNWKFLLQGDYFKLSTDTLPLLHYWSLGVEEQFYVLFPIILRLIHRFFLKQAFYVLALIALFSLSACIIITNYSNSFAFYALPTRAWELLAGALMAIAPRLYNISRSSVQVLLQCFAITTLLLAFFFVEEGSDFPGWQAMIPVAATVLLILSVDKESITGRLLASRTMVAVGKRSFSLYVWHWPIFCFIDYALILYRPDIRFFSKLFITFIVCELSYRWIENPARHWINTLRVHTCFLIAASGVVLVGSLGYFSRQSGFLDASEEQILRGGVVLRWDRQDAPRIALLGDSNASMYGTALREICSDLCSELRVLSTAGGDVLPHTYGTENPLWQPILRSVTELQPHAVILANHWAEKLMVDPQRAEAAVEDLSIACKCKILVLGQPPIIPDDWSRADVRAKGLQPVFESASHRAGRQQGQRVLQSLSSELATMVPTDELLLQSDGSIRVLDESGREYYWDPTHLAHRAALLVVYRILPYIKISHANM